MSNDFVLDWKLRSQAVDENSKLWQLLVNLAEHKEGWDKFSNHTDGGGDPEVSLESWHDNFHNLLGSGRNSSGNMAWTTVAGVGQSSSPYFTSSRSDSVRCSSIRSSG